MCLTVRQVSCRIDMNILPYEKAKAMNEDQLMILVHSS